jgi:3-phosphoglycerate kinase
MARMKNLESIALRDKRVLLRVDLNVPLDDRGMVLDDTRIQAALPTLTYALERNAACVVIAHLGRPGGKRVESLTLAPVAERLAELLPKHTLRRCDQVVGQRATAMAQELRGAEILLLENLRFHPGEEAGDIRFALELASLAELYINDAFAACHRKHASVYALSKIFPEERRAIGLLLRRELDGIAPVVDNPERPFIAIFGGAKVFDKLDALGALVDRVDELLVGGAMAYTFLKASGHHVGDSMVEENLLDVAREIIARAGPKLILPSDHVIASKIGTELDQITDEIPDKWIGLDIGPVTIARFVEKIRGARTVVWNGPLGKIEHDTFLAGTRHIAEAIAHADVMSIAGGGETGEVIHRLGLAEQFTHLSTGGGAFLAYIARGTLPALDAFRGG